MDRDEDAYGDPERESELDDEMIDGRRALSWRALRHHASRRRWWETLWDDVCLLRQRYRLPVRSRWWEDEIQVEALAALAAWVARYDSGDWEDPPGKLTLLFEIERVEALLRDGNEPFQPHRDRLEFNRHLELLGVAASGW